MAALSSLMTETRTCSLYAASEVSRLQLDAGSEQSLILITSRRPAALLRGQMAEGQK
jgi:hypothetical protein